MSTIDQTVQTRNDNDQISLLRETVNIYQQKKQILASCSWENEWVNTLTKEQFLGRDPKSLDYNLGLVAQGTYSKNWRSISAIERLNRDELADLGIDARLLKDSSTGFESIICRFNDLYIISFAGSNELIDFYADLRQGLGYYEPQYFQAVNLTNILSNAVKGKVVCIGHSLGGGLATFASIASGSPCVAFSSAGVAENTIKNVGLDYQQAKKRAEDGLVRFYVVRYDWLDLLQSVARIPPALGSKIVMDYHEDGANWRDWLPHRYLQYSFIAHLMPKILSMMCHFTPWRDWRPTAYGDLNEQLAQFSNEWPMMDDDRLTNWQGCCENCIKQGNEKAFAELLTLKNKPVTINELVSYSVRSADAQFMKLLFDSTYASAIKKSNLAQERSYLHLTAQTGRVEQSELLLRNGFAINAVDSFGNTPLHDALNSHALLVAELLLRQGADWKIKNKQGYDCRDILNNHMIKIELLSNQGKIMREKICQMMI